MASSLAAEIKEKHGVESELIASKGGCFEVTVDDQLMFSKLQLDRFPEPGEILQMLDSLQA